MIINNFGVCFVARLHVILGQFKGVKWTKEKIIQESSSEGRGFYTLSLWIPVSSLFLSLSLVRPVPTVRLA